MSLKFTIPTNNIIDLTTFFGLPARKQSKTETLTAGAQSWSRFVNLTKLYGTRLLVATQHDSGLDLFEPRWQPFVDALKQDFWNLQRAAPFQQDREEDAAAVTIIGALPYFRFVNICSERGIYLLEIPTIDQLGVYDTDRLEPTNEVFAPMFGAFDDRAIELECVHYEGLFANIAL